MEMSILAHSSVADPEGVPRVPWNPPFKENQKNVFNSDRTLKAEKQAACTYLDRSRAESLKADIVLS